MSYDLAVWFPHQRLSDKEAEAIYVKLCNGEPAQLQPHPAVAAFYEELVAKHPEIDDVPDDKIDDHDYCPWSVAHDRSDAHVIMCSVWSKAEYVSELISALSEKHGLVLFDPQGPNVFFPEGSGKKSWWQFWK